MIEIQELKNKAIELGFTNWNVSEELNRYLWLSELQQWLRVSYFIDAMVLPYGGAYRYEVLLDGESKGVSEDTDRDICDAFIKALWAGIEVLMLNQKSIYLSYSELSDLCKDACIYGEFDYEEWEKENLEKYKTV